MRRFASLAALGIGFVIAGCGGSSGGSWGVVSTAQTHGKEPVFIDNALIGRPSSLEVKVSSNPSITVHEVYSFLCGEVLAKSTPTEYSPALQTPLTYTLTIPPGPPASCHINVLTQKSQSADTTVTLLMRSPP